MYKGKNGFLGGGGAVKHTVYPKNPKLFRMTRVWNTRRSVNDMDGEVDQMAKICLAEAEQSLGIHLGKSLNLSVPPIAHL